MQTFTSQSGIGQRSQGTTNFDVINNSVTNGITSTVAMQDSTKAALF